MSESVIEDTDLVVNNLAERATVGAALLGAAHADVVLAIVEDSDFASELRAIDVLKAIRDMRGPGEPVDAYLVHSELVRCGQVTNGQSPTSAVYLAELAETALSPDEAGAYALAVVEASYRRRAQESAAVISQAAADWSLESLQETIAVKRSTLERAWDRVAQARQRAALRLVNTP